MRAVVACAVAVLACAVLVGGVAAFEHRSSCPSLPLPPPSTAEALREALGEGRTLSAGEARRLYHCIIEHGASALKAEGDPEGRREEGEEVCALSKKKHAVRSAARKYVRERGSALSEALLRARDYFKYGRADGPSFEELLEQRAAEAPEEPRHVHCRMVAESSGRTNGMVDSLVAYRGYVLVAVGLLVACFAAWRGVRLGRRQASHGRRRPRAKAH